MTDAVPFGIPVSYVRRFTVKALKVVETEVEAMSLDQAAAMANFLAARDKLRLLSVMENGPVADPVADLVDPEVIEEVFTGLPHGSERL